MTPSASDIASKISDLITEIRGAKDRLVNYVRPISKPEPGALSFLRPSAHIELTIRQITGMTIICSEQHAQKFMSADVTCLVTENPRLAFMRAVRHFFAPAPLPPGVHPTTVIDPSAVIDSSATIGPFCVIGARCTIGARTILHAHVTLYSDVSIGADVVIHAGTVIGADGFGYERNAGGDLEKFPHLGGVIVENDVEIGSNTSIDRGALGNTTIRAGTRIDNQCHISHNVDIGRHVAVIAQSMLGGSVRIGDYAWLAPAAIIMNQAKIGADATIGLGAVVTKDVAQGQTVMGSPAVPIEEFRAQRVALKALLK